MINIQLHRIKSRWRYFQRFGFWQEVNGNMMFMKDVSTKLQQISRTCATDTNTGKGSIYN